MSEPIKPAYELTAAEQRNLIALLGQSKLLPEFTGLATPPFAEYPEAAP